MFTTNSKFYTWPLAKQIMSAGWTWPWATCLQPVILNSCFCCKVSILCSLSDTLQANYLMTAFCSYIFLSLRTWDLQLTEQTLPEVIPLVWILFLGFTRLFTRELHGSYQCRYSMPWIWGWGSWAVWVFCLKVYYWRKMSPEKRNFHFLFLPSLVFPSLCPIVTLVWSLF